MTRYDDYKPRDDKRPDRFATIGDLFKHIKPTAPPAPEKADEKPQEQ